LGQDRPRLLTLRAAADLGDLLVGHRELAKQFAVAYEVVEAGAGSADRLLPDAGELLGVLLGVLAPGLGQREQLAAALAYRLDQALVLELRERRVHRAGTGPPHPVGALLDLLDDLVTVARLLGQQRHDRRAHVTAPGPAAPAPVSARPETRTLPELRSAEAELSRR